MVHGALDDKEKRKHHRPAVCKLDLGIPSPENLLDKQMLRLNPKPRASETQGVVMQSVFYQVPGNSDGGLKFQT